MDSIPSGRIDSLGWGAAWGGGLGLGLWPLHLEISPRNGPWRWGSIPGWGRPPGEGNGNPLQYSSLENAMDRGTWWATVHGVAESQTWLTTTFTFHFPVNSPAAAAKSLQSCPTLCDPRDGSPPGSPVPGILQARTLERVAIAFSNACKWKVKVKSLSRVLLLATPWTTAYRAPPSMGFSRQGYWSGVPLPSPVNSTSHNQRQQVPLSLSAQASPWIGCTTKPFWPLGFPWGKVTIAGTKSLGAVHSLGSMLLGSSSFTICVVSAFVFCITKSSCIHPLLMGFVFSCLGCHQSPTISVA